MSTLRFILGRAGTGKTETCLAELAAHLQAEGEEGPPLILLVPEQATFQMERALLTRLSRAATARAQVLSFRRLAQRVLQELGGGGGRVLGEVGRRMALRAILQRQAGQFRLFSGTAGKAGFVDRLAGSLSELRVHRVSAQDLDDQRRLLAEGGSEGTLLDLKLHDLALVARAYEAYLGDRFTDPDDLLNLVATRLPRTTLLRGARVWVDGFAGFTPQEYAVLEALLQVAGHITVALCVDGRLPLSVTPEPTDLFFPTHETYLRLSGLARAAGTMVEPDLVLDTDAPPRFRSTPALARLEGGLYRRRFRTWAGEPAGIRLTAAADRRHEVECTAREILNLCREQGYRYREISVTVRDFEGYDDLISQVFGDYGIPHFIDRKRPLAHHPLMELVKAALDVTVTGCSYGAVFRYLKTDLAPLDRTAVDGLENYVLEHGIRGNLWTQEEPWRFTRRYSLEEDPEDAARRRQADLERIDADRRAAARPLAGLIKDLKEGEPLTVQACARALFNFLAGLEVPAALAAWSREAEMAGRLEEAAAHRQVWDRLLEVLDELVDALGSETTTPAEFREIVAAGIEGLRLGLIPPGLDQVLVGSVERSRQPDVRATFLLGVNEGRFPLVAGEDVVFNDAERQSLAAGGMELAPDSRRRLFQERYLAYIAVTRPRELLWISWPTADTAGRPLSPSEIPARVRRLFPDLSVKTPPLHPTEPHQAGTSGRLAGMVVRALRRARQGEAPASPWLEAYRWLVAHPGRRDRVRPVLAALAEPRAVPALPPDLAAALHGSTLKTSVSRLESFAACPFQHFAAHTLGLEERARHRVDAPQLGVLLHAVLRRFVEELDRRGLDWRDLSADTVSGLAGEVLDELLPRLQNEILLSSARYRHLAAAVRETVEWALFVLGEHARRSRFRPAALEMAFGLAGKGNTLPPYSLPLGPGRGMQLRGQIDRIDLAGPVGDGPEVGSREPGGTGGTPPWLRVIDYKRTTRSLALQDVYHGLSLQLPAYLLVALETAPRWRGGPAAAAGVFYFGLNEPTLREEGPLDPEEARTIRLRRARFQGLVLGDPIVIDAMDRDLKGNSDLIPARINKDGRVGKGDAVVSAQQLATLLGFVRRRLTDLGRRILSGQIEVRPYRRQNGQVPCGWCPYRSVCRFEPGMGGRYRNLANLKAAEFWERLEAGPGPEEGS